MRIIAGTAGRRHFRVPNTSVRPTTDRTREALFSMLAAYVPGAKVLDLFAGSGSLGMEALSRGATSCIFVDEHRDCANTVRTNLKTLRLHGGKIVQSDVLSFIKKISLSNYDLIFADPPYTKNPSDRDFIAEMFAIENFSEILSDDGMLVIEIDEHHEVEEHPQWNLVDRRKYGGCSILFYQKKGAN